MDADRFDALTRALPRRGSRRHALTTALGGVLGLLGLASSAQSAAKKCKGLTGKKKKKCLKKAKANQAECRNNADCPDKTRACQGGRCQRICPTGACPGCDLCLIHLESDGDRPRLCTDSAAVPPLVQQCASDADCPLAEPLCVLFDTVSCTGDACGTCVVSTGSCDEPECVDDEDCPNQAESCQVGTCRPVCPPGACAGCNFCAVRYPISSGRTQACADSFTFVDSVTCTTEADCAAGDICIRFPASSCTQSPCGQCAFPPGTCA